jgi:hypothetical protein
VQAPVPPERLRLASGLRFGYVESVMATTVLVGAQWGDEGKGKIIDVLTEQADVVVRYQGATMRATRLRSATRSMCCT